MPSPSRLKANSNVAIVPTGKSIRWGWLRITEILPFSNSILPRLGKGGWIPMPKKLKMISAPTNPASPADTDTMTGLMTFGKTWALKMRGY